jgi:protoporphyrinogen oxidase
MEHPRVVVLGGGLSGVATAYGLARAGWRDVTVIERGPSLGGLAGSFQRDGRFYPLGYHHILHRDRTLLFFLDLINVLPDVRWRKIRMLFHTGTRSYDLGTARGFLEFPLSLTDKLRFVRLMLRAYSKSEWSDWHDADAAQFIDAWASPAVRRAIFEPLCQLKYQLPCCDVSAAWLGARLHFREGSAPLGYIPNTNWTTALCEGVTRLLHENGVVVRLGATITEIATDANRIAEVVVAGRDRLRADVFVSTVPIPVLQHLLPVSGTEDLASMRYTALLSVICATRQTLGPDFYWMNLASLDRSACGIFNLSALNPTIGAPGDTCVNFVTHLQSREHPMFSASDDALLEAYLDDCRHIFGVSLTPFWKNIARLPLYSPIFSPGYRNPPSRSPAWRNLYFAGNYRTFPSVASTGTALGSGLDAARQVLADHGQSTDLPEQVRAFRLRRMPRG